MSKQELINPQPTLFSYANIDADTTAYLQQNAQETRGLLKRTSEDIIQIGKNLLEAKARLPHGQFIPWVKAELGISQPTAWRFMQVAQGKPIKSFTMNDLIPQIAGPEDEGEDEQEEVIPATLYLQVTSTEEQERINDWNALSQEKRERLIEMAEAAIIIGCGMHEDIEKHIAVWEFLAHYQDHLHMDGQELTEFLSYGRRYTKETPVAQLLPTVIWELAGTYACWLCNRSGLYQNGQLLFDGEMNLGELYTKIWYSPDRLTFAELVKQQEQQ